LELPAIGNGSTDVKAGTLNGLFDFTSTRKAPKLLLDPTTGLIVRSCPSELLELANKKATLSMGVA
jgi:hypothetical protein